MSRIRTREEILREFVELSTPIYDHPPLKMLVDVQKTWLYQIFEEIANDAVMYNILSSTEGAASIKRWNSMFLGPVSINKDKEPAL